LLLLLSQYFHTVTHYSFLLFQNQPLFEIFFCLGFPPGLPASPEETGAKLLSFKNPEMSHRILIFPQLSAGFFFSAASSPGHGSGSPGIFSVRAFPDRSSCQVPNFAQSLHSGKIYDLRKSVVSVEGCRKWFPCPIVNIHSRCELWITLVDKVVDNVENLELSTGISPLSPFLPALPKNA